MISRCCYLTVSLVFEAEGGHAHSGSGIEGGFGFLIRPWVLEYGDECRHDAVGYTPKSGRA